MLLKSLPIIDEMNEVEMVKSTPFFKRKGFLPISIAFRSSNTSMGSSEVIQEYNIPAEFAKSHGNIPVKTKKVIIIDNYGKNFILNTDNPNALESLRDWYLEQYSSTDGWTSRVEEFIVIITKRGNNKDWMLKFKRGESSREQGVYSLRLEEVKEPGQKWKKESSYREEKLKELTKGISTDQCVLDYQAQSRRKPKCV